MRKPELLSPAGRMSAAIAAINNGADALYLGGMNFGARSFASNFDYLQLKELIDLAHEYKVKVYTTVNTLVYDDEFEQLESYVGRLYELGVDALLVQDLGVLDFIRSTYPDFECHASTQMHIYNRDALMFLKQLGVKRAVLARETSLKQLESYQDIQIEKELFVHGALCISFSGQCLFSSLNNNRSGNRGSCAQCCRMPYDLLVEDKVLNTDKYLLSPKDLMEFDKLSQLVSLVDSFKIEGRMKSDEYVGLVTSLYRNKIDDLNYKLSKDDLYALKTTFSRGYTEGFLFDEYGDRLMNHYRPNHLGVKVGTVVMVKNGMVRIRLNDVVHQGDGIRFITDEDFGFVLNKIYKDGLLVNHGEQGDVIELEVGHRVKVGNIMVKTSDIYVVNRIDAMNKQVRKVPLKLKVVFHQEQPFKLLINDDFEYVSDFIPDKARNHPMSDTDIMKQLRKTNDTIYDFYQIGIDNDRNSFMPVSKINEARRNALSAYQHRKDRNIKRYNVAYTLPDPTREKLVRYDNLNVMVMKEDQLKKCLEMGITNIYVENYDLYDKYKADNRIKRWLSNAFSSHHVKPAMCGDIGAIRNNCQLDYSLNVVNSHSLAFLEHFSPLSICLSEELTCNQIENMDLTKTKALIEVCVYGKTKLMTTKYCLVNHLLSDNDKINCSLCHKKDYYLKDVFDQKFYLEGDHECNMGIYDHKPKDWIDKINVLKQAGVDIFRLSFTDESADETGAIIQKFQTNYR